MPRVSTPTRPQSSQGKADTLFKGETLSSILLNAYGWWTVATIALFAGYAMVAMGIVLGVLALLGFRHAKRAEAARVAGDERRDDTDERCGPREGTPPPSSTRTTHHATAREQPGRSFSMSPVAGIASSAAAVKAARMARWRSATRSGSWSGRGSGSSATTTWTSRTLPSRTHAVAVAMNRAKEDQPSEVLVLGPSGAIEERRTFGEDPLA